MVGCIRKKGGLKFWVVTFRIAIWLENICLLDGLWTATSEFSVCGKVQKNTSGQNQIMGTRNLRCRESALYSELKALIQMMENMLQYLTCQNFGIDSKDLITIIKELRAWSVSFNGIERDRDSSNTILNIQDFICASNI